MRSFCSRNGDCSFVQMSWYRYECICLVCFPAVYATSAFLFRCRYQRGAWLIKLSAGAVLLLAALQYGIYISYILRFGGRPSASAVMTVLGTHTAEVQGFLLDQFGLRYMVLAVGIAIMSWAVPCFISERIVSSRPESMRRFCLFCPWGWRWRTDIRRKATAICFRFQKRCASISAGC